MIRPTVSLCMIVKNEEKYLEKCLQSVQNVVDEIIVVDTGSTDATVEIAKRYQAKVYFFDWIDDFAAARNYSLDQSTCDYVLVLDADEYLDEATNLAADLALGKDYYSVRIRNLYLDSVLYHQNVRLFKRIPEMRFFGKLHENLPTADPSLDVTSESAHFTINHVGYMYHVVKEKNKADRNYRIMLKAVEEEPSGYNYFNLGVVYAANEEYEKALDAFIKSFKLDKTKTYIKFLLVHMGKCYLALKQYTEGMYLLGQATQDMPDYPDLHFRLGTLYEEAGYWKDAEKCYQRCLAIGDGQDLVNMEGVGGYLSYLRLTAIYESMGYKEEAFDIAFQAILDKKHYQPALSHYLTLMLRSNISQEETYEHLSKVYPLSSVEDIQHLLFGLYATRHPLLYRYVTDHKESLRGDFQAVAFQYSKMYEEARREWNKLEEIPQDNVIDIILLALLLQDGELLVGMKEFFNVTTKEWQTLKKIILREERGNLKMTAFVEQILLKLCTQLIVLEEFDLFEYVTCFLVQGSLDAQTRLAEILSDFGFSDTAIELLAGHLNGQRTSAKVLELLGDILRQQGNVDDAIPLYQQLRSVTKEHSSYLRLYLAYEKAGDQVGMLRIKEEIQKEFPNSKWAKQVT